MKLLKQLLDNNDKWAQTAVASDPDFFARLADQQEPEFCWIGCSDSRVPSSQITGMMPGDVFVHRNVANLVAHQDANSQAMLHYAVEYLRVKHLIITGHYGCGGVRAAMRDALPGGPLGEWLRPIHALYLRNRAALDALPEEHDRWHRLCELNVTDQVSCLTALPMIRDAWSRGAELYVHGWIYNISDGHLHDLHVTAGPSHLTPV